MNMHAALMFLLLSLPVLSQAEVTYSNPDGFAVTHTVATSASTEQSWDHMINHIDQWWHSDHSWSGDASNFHIKPGVGGCFCEHLPPGGEVEHLRIIYFNPGKEIRFDGALGPLQTMATEGRMVWKITPAESGSGSTITFTYLVNGSVEGGLTAIAPAVDGVIGQQIKRLAEGLN